MTVRLVRSLSTAVLTVGLLAAVAGPGHAQFVDYDDFSGGAIDPEKWQGTSAEGSAGAPTGTSVRIIDNGSLRLALTSWGGDASNSGFVTTRRRLDIRQLGTLGGTGFITGMRARVTVLAAETQPCPANSDTNAGGFNALRARADMFGYFFNDGSGGPDNRTGNVNAFVGLIRTGDGLNRIRAGVQRCVTANCSTLGTVVPEIFFTMPWALNAPLDLEIAWDPANDKFIITATNPDTSATEVRDLVYQGIVTDTDPPAVFTTNALQVQNSVKNCGGARKRVTTEALFDNVQVRRQP